MGTALLYIRELGLAVLLYTPSTQRTEAGELQFEDQPELYSKFKAKPSYIGKSELKQQITNNNKTITPKPNDMRD